jgi:hypothetical protein
MNRKTPLAFTHFWYIQVQKLPIYHMIHFTSRASVQCHNFYFCPQNKLENLTSQNSGSTSVSIIIHKWIPKCKQSDLPLQSWCTQTPFLPPWWCSAWELPRGGLRSHLRWGPQHRQKLQNMSQAVPKQTHPAIERKAGLLTYVLSYSRGRDILPFYLSFHVRYWVLLHQCWIYMPAIVEIIRKVYILIKFSLKTLFDQNINFYSIELLKYKITNF